jgi:hypothetical protein
MFLSPRILLSLNPLARFEVRSQGDRIEELLGARVEPCLKVWSSEKVSQPLEVRGELFI